MVDRADKMTKGDTMWSTSSGDRRSFPFLSKDLILIQFCCLGDGFFSLLFPMMNSQAHTQTFRMEREAGRRSFPRIQSRLWPPSATFYVSSHSFSKRTQLFITPSLYYNSTDHRPPTNMYRGGTPIHQHFPPFLDYACSCMLRTPYLIHFINLEISFLDFLCHFRSA